MRTVYDGVNAAAESEKKVIKIRYFCIRQRLHTSRVFCMRYASVINLKFNSMSVAKLREELHKLIEVADEKLLAAVFEAFQDRHKIETGLLTPEQRTDLDERVQRYKNEETTLHTWSQARKKIENRSE